MARSVAFLRGINVGGHRVSKDELVDVFERLGFEGVSTFRASGNVLFDAAAAKPRAAAIESALKRALGYEVPVFLRTAKQIEAIATLEPFTANQHSASTGKLQVTFLARRPAAAAASKALGLATADDLLALEASELYWLPKRGTQESDLDHAALARLLGPATMRTMGTVELIAGRLTR